MLGARKILLVLVAGLAASLALAGPGGGGGGGKGGGGGGGPGGGGGGGSSGKPGSSVDDFYGDMALIDRDVNGVPILVEGLGPKDKWMLVRAPIVFPDKLESDECPLTADTAAPLGAGSIYTHLGIEAYRIPFVDGEIPEMYADCVTEADFGRLSVMRSPPKVLDAGLLELVTVLSTPGATLGLDEAGRFMVSYDEDGVLVEKTIDAPRENLAGFQSLLETTVLSHPEVNNGAAVPLEERPVHEDHPERAALRVLDRAAAMLGAAADKFHPMGLDEMMYATAILGIGSDMNVAAKDLFGQPHLSLAEKAFPYFNFYKYEYDRAATYAGDVCYLKVGEVFDTTPVSAEVEVVREPILQVIFPPLADAAGYEGGLELLTHETGFSYTGFSGENAWGFARAVDDARAVINWMHEHPVPIELVEHCN